MKTMKQKALEHYHWMMILAGLQDPDTEPNYIIMSVDIEEDWRSDSCIYCNTHPGDDCTDMNDQSCELGDNVDDCCDGLWVEMDDSETWSEWIKNAWAVHQYIVEHG
jgi:hypothetical protein